MKNFALAGNPNCGKTTLFNSLTGSTAHVGNWPGVTVDKRVGLYKNNKNEINIVDLPGIYSLSPYTPEEVITRNYIIDEKPDCVINIVDVTNLERNLYLTTQLLEMDVPIVVALNMMDLLEENGDKINVVQLQKELGVPVVSISALKENNLSKLMDIAIEASSKKREGSTVLEESKLSHLIKDLTIAFHTLDFPNPLFHACKLAELDELEAKDHPQLIHMVKDFREEDFSSDKDKVDFEAVIADERYKYITKHYSKCLVKNKKNDDNKKQDKIDKVLTHKIWGIPIFIGILFLIFHLVFSNNLFFLSSLINKDCFSNIDENSIWIGFKGLLFTTNGINSPGVFLSNLINALTNAFTLSIKSLLINEPNWISGFLCDGVIGGVSAVIGFLPQILLLFLLFSILEDSGYMARVAFILDRIFKKFGLSGRSFLPMIMGFGCSVPAMINTRTIADEKERIATIRVIPFFSCGAKLPTLTALAGCIVSSFGFANVDLITLGMYLLGIITAIVTVLIMRNTSLKGGSSPFIMELPAYHMPQFKSTMLLVMDKAKHFIKKAFTIILASTIVVWFISHFNFDWQYLADDQLNESILANLGKLIKPLFVPLGFGLLEYGWIFVVAALTGLLAKENTIATMGTLCASVLTSLGIAHGSGNEAIRDMVLYLKTTNELFAAHGSAILLSFIAFNMLTIPCFATVATAKTELGKSKFISTILFWLVTSFIISSAIFLVGTYVWPLAIYLGFLVLTFVIIYLKNKNKLKGEK